MSEGKYSHLKHLHFIRGLTAIPYERGLNKGFQGFTMKNLGHNSVGKYIKMMQEQYLPEQLRANQTYRSKITARSPRAAAISTTFAKGLSTSDVQVLSKHKDPKTF